MYEQVQNGEMGLLLFEMFFDAPNVVGKKSKTRNSRPTFVLAYLHLMFVL